MRPLNVLPILLLSVLAFSSCATRVDPLPAPPSVIEVPPAKPAPVPPGVMVKREPDFRTRLLSFFSGSQTKPTPSFDNSPPPRK
jgi:hypothetical protein